MFTSRLEFFMKCSPCLVKRAKAQESTGKVTYEEAVENYMKL